MRNPAADPETLLDWYDRHARQMPWRVPPQDKKTGTRPDPYSVWLSEVMLQQTTVAAVKDYFVAFTKRWPRIQDLAKAEDADVMAAWAGLGYYARARNLLKCARVVTRDYDGSFPTEESELLKLPGIGPYTAAALAAIAFDRPTTVLDGNVERVMARLHAVKAPLPGSKEILRAHAASLTPTQRPGDYAQAVMDLGATICTPRNPACGICPWITNCRGRETGIASSLPRKTPKPEKPTRLGIVYYLERSDGAVLLETRPPKGLLGGMLGLPGTAWNERMPDDNPPIDVKWTISPKAIRHTFTHFHLILDLAYATVPQSAKPSVGSFRLAADVSPADLPTVMRKAYKFGANLRQTRPDL